MPSAARWQAIEQGLIQREIQDVRLPRAAGASTRGDAIVVGVNSYQARAAHGDRGAADRSGARTAAAASAWLPCAPRATRTAWRSALDAVVTAAAESGANLVPPIVDAVEAFATVGEISDALRRVFGEHEEIDV